MKKISSDKARELINHELAKVVSKITSLKKKIHSPYSSQKYVLEDFSPIEERMENIKNYIKKNPQHFSDNDQDTGKFYSNTCVVLIDDDQFVRDTWKTFSETENMPFASFSCVEEFIKSHNRFEYAPEATIYIDYHLSDGRSGIEEAKKLKKLGFKRIYLTTGANLKNVDIGDGILGVVSKTPHWVDDPVVKDDIITFGGTMSL